MDILSRLESEFGDAVLPRAAAESDAVDGVQPQAIAAPRDEEAAQALVAWCGRENVAFVPRGGGTKLHIGAPPSRCDLIISTEKLTQIFDHDEGNATVQAGAGISLSALDAEMRKRGQFVPLNVRMASLTLGGAVAANFRFRERYGAPRDLVTGLHAVLSDGRLVKAGAKVVKNVAGYDLNKLFIGSFGSLGLITEVTIRLRPIPATTAYWQLEFASWNDAVKQAWEIVNGPFEPASLCLNWNEDGLTPGTMLMADFEGGETAVTSQLDKLLPVTPGPVYWGVANPPWALTARLPLQSAPIWAKSAQNKGVDMWWSCATGEVTLIYHHGKPDLAYLRTEAEKLGGFLVVERAPSEVKTPELVWGKPRGDFALMEKLKQTFDAANVCAPGRFIGGL